MLAGCNRLIAYAGDVVNIERNELWLVLEFLNSIDVEEGTDELASTAGWEAWLSAHDLPVAPRTQAAALALRESLRAATGGQSIEPPSVGVTIAVDSDGRPMLVGADALGQIAAAAATLGIDGRWGRVKLCPADDCRWAFYDLTRNRSRQWCSMAVCGARKKSRDFRARRARR